MEKESSQGKAASTLNANQIKKSISGSKVQKRKDVVQALESPFVFDWSHLSTENETELLSALLKVISPVREESKSKNKSTQKNDAKSQQTGSTHIEGIASARKHLAIGLRDVTKAINCSETLVVFCEKSPDPSLLTKLLVPLCQIKGIPLVPIKKFSISVSKSLNVLRCLTFALKKPAADPTSSFHSAYLEIMKILSLAPKQALTEHPNKVAPAKITVTKAETFLKKLSEVPQEDPEESKFYLKKGTSGVRFIPGVTRNPLITGEAAQKNTFGADFIALKPVKHKNSPITTLLRRPKLKRAERDESNPKIKNKKAKN